MKYSSTYHVRNQEFYIIHSVKSLILKRSHYTNSLLSRTKPFKLWLNARPCMSHKRPVTCLLPLILELYVSKHIDV